MNISVVVLGQTTSITLYRVMTECYQIVSFNVANACLFDLKEYVLIY